MKPVWRNFWTDAVLLLQMLALLVTGIILKYGLPPGQGRGRGYGGGWGWRGGHGGHRGDGSGPRELWGLSRHEWGDVHFWIAVSLIAVLVLHLVLHWSWITHRVRCLVKRRRPAARECESES
jgi:hypothetical protein